MKISVISLVLIIISTCCVEINKSQVNNNDFKRVSLEINSCSWFTSIQHASRMDFGHVMLFIKGKTNAERLTILTYGDGLRGNFPLIIKSDGTFSDTINISFTPLQFGIDLPKPFHSETIVKAYLKSEEFDTTLYSGKLSYEQKQTVPVRR
jgi:hypothetical protein